MKKFSKKKEKIKMTKQEIKEMIEKLIRIRDKELDKLQDKDTLADVINLVEENINKLTEDK